MRVVVTGQVGLDKTAFLGRVVEMAAQQGFATRQWNVGSLMYAEAPDVAPGRILDLPLARLTSLRRSVFKDVLASAKKDPHVIINTHATFRWSHGLFYAFDYDQMQSLQADLHVVMVDNIDRVHARLIRDGHVDHTLKDLMVWREEEVMATELLSQIVGRQSRFYIMAVGSDDSTVEAMVRLIFRPHLRKAYLSFPMSHVGSDPNGRSLLSMIEQFRRQMKNYFICFDPGDVEEKHLCQLALNAAQAGHRTFDVEVEGVKTTLDTAQVVDIIADIDGQIYARDFKLIDQSDMIISLVPALATGQPALSSGVERELQHAHEAAKDVFVIWLPEAPPSPFVSETATKVFRSTAEAIDFFLANNYVPPPAGTLFS